MISTNMILSDFIRETNNSDSVAAVLTIHNFRTMHAQLADFIF